MKLTKSKLRRIIKEELQNLVIEKKDQCGPKPKWPGNKAASLKVDPTGAVLKDQRGWYNCRKRNRPLPKGYPFAQVNRTQQAPPASKLQTNWDAIKRLVKRLRTEDFESDHDALHELHIELHRAAEWLDTSQEKQAATPQELTIIKIHNVIKQREKAFHKRINKR